MSAEPAGGLLQLVLWVLIIVPPLFLLAGMQYAALTLPFWDHFELIDSIDRAASGTLTLPDLWSAHNHSRPMMYRIVMVLNALATGWDLRSEYIYLLGSLWGAFLIQALALKKLCLGLDGTRRLILIAALSIVAFSPVGHNNHWWSMMFQLTFAHAMIVLALLAVAFGPLSWKHSFAAAAACWLATYTLTNGLVAFVACALVAHMSGPSLSRITRFGVFWIANIILVLVAYLPGLKESGGPPPAVGSLLLFVLSYMGAPLAGLIHFPFRSMFDIPDNVTFTNAIAGFFLLGLILAAAFPLRRADRRDYPAARAFLGFALFALGSAAFTAWGRAEAPPHGLSWANSSRYTLFSSYLLYALMYYWALPRSGDSRRVSARFAVVFIVMAAGFGGRTYFHSIPIYRESHEFNRTLSRAWGREGTDLDKFLYPNAEQLARFRAKLRGLRMGPYRDAFPAAANNLTEQIAGVRILDEFGISGMRDDPAAGRILFAHPHSQFGMLVPSGRTGVRFRYGIIPGAVTVTPPTDGVEFRLLLRTGPTDKALWSFLWRVGAVTDGAITVPIPKDLPPLSVLIFETLPAGSTISDWAYWSDIVFAGP